MAINFLNTVNLNKNQLNNAAIQNLATDPGSGVEGQIYFNTAVDALKIYAGGAWVEVGATSGVETFTNTSGTYVAFGTDNASAIGNVTVGTIDLTAVDGTSTSADRFLTKNNKWATIPFGDITDVNGGTYITTTNSAGPVVTVNHDLTSRTDTTSTVSTNVFPVVDSVSTNTTGHVTAVNVKTVTVPDNNTTYDLTTAPTGTAVRLTGSDSTNDNVTISGFSGQTTTTRISGTELRVALTPTVTIANSLTLTNGAFTQTAGGENNLNANLDMNGNKLLQVANGTDATDGVNLGQVESLVAGIGLFKGGYNATTGLTINLTTNGSLDGASNIALDQGDFFVVTTAGTAFYSETLEVGDMIYANVGIAANSNPAQTVYTVVIQDANIAGAGATDGATQKGVAGFDTANFTVSGTGWVQLKEEVLSGRMAKVTLTGGDNSVAGETTFTVNLVTLFGSGANADDAIATVKEEASNLIVYPEVTGNGTGSLDFVFMPQVGNGDYRAIISIV